jgi:hypothetical protein
MPANRDNLDQVLKAKQRLTRQPPRRRRAMTRTTPRTNGPRLAPTRKWWAATVTGGGTVAVAWAEAGDWTSTLTVTAVGFAVQRAVAWLVSNGDSAGTTTGTPA